jgi:integrative and conjugative element protein (TIGR02256 family)
MNDLEFWSFDRRFGLRIGPEAVEEMLVRCAEAGAAEVGGILIGEYTSTYDCAIVHSVTGPSTDAEASRYTFIRRAAGLQPILDRLWRREHRYYLGEWHFHPGAAPTPSGRDRAQLQEISVDEGYRCPEPLLLIVGGAPPLEWTVSAHVFPRNKPSVPLRRGRDCSHLGVPVWS